MNTMDFLFNKKKKQPAPEKEKQQEPGRCPGCPNHCLLTALKCGKGRNLLRQKELMG